MACVSVIIPTYNRSRLLAQAIRSVLSQVYSDLEIIVVDDGSTDDTPEVVQRIADPRVRYIRQQNAERCVARNNGARNATGQYYAFLDSDDLWFPHTLATQMEALRDNNDAGVVFGPSVRINSEVEFVYPADFFNSGCGSTVNGLHERLLVRCTISAPTVLCRAEAFWDVGGWDESFRGCEDWDLWIRLSASTQFHQVRNPLAAYRVHDGNSVNDLRREEAGVFHVFDKHVRTMKTPAAEKIRTEAELALHTRLGFMAVCQSDPHAEEWLSKAREKALELNSLDMLGKLLTHYARSYPTHDWPSIRDAAKLLYRGLELTGLARSRHGAKEWMRDFWAAFVHGAYRLQDYDTALACARQLLRDCGPGRADRGIWSIAARSALARRRHGSHDRVRFPEEAQLLQVLYTNEMQAGPKQQ